MDKRLTDRLLNHWKLLCKGQSIPAIETFNSGAIQDIWPQCMKIGVQAGTRSYYIEYMGDALAKIVGRNLTGERVVATMLKTPNFKLIQNLDTLLKQNQPTQEEGQFINTKNKVVKYRSVILPFGKEASHISHFVLGVSWREF